jgi:hypothetical protein
MGDGDRQDGSTTRRTPPLTSPTRATRRRRNPQAEVSTAAPAYLRDRARLPALALRRKTLRRTDRLICAAPYRRLSACSQCRGATIGELRVASMGRFRIRPRSSDARPGPLVPARHGAWLAQHLRTERTEPSRKTVGEHRQHESTHRRRPRMSPAARCNDRGTAPIRSTRFVPSPDTAAPDSVAQWSEGVPLTAGMLTCLSPALEGAVVPVMGRASGGGTTWCGSVARTE